MPDINPGAPEASDSPPTWIDAGEAARLLGVSEKTVWRRAKAGTLEARKVARGRGGFVWEIALEATGQTTDRPDKSDRTATGQSGAPSFDSRLKATGQPDKSDRPTDQTATGQNEETTARLLAQLEGENRFLRGVIEQLQRDGAETRNALREALRAMPKQLAAPSPATPDEGGSDAPQRPQNGAANNVPTPTPDAPKSAPLTYSEIADQLEEMMNQ